MKISESTEFDIIEHARAEYPRESCGLVVNLYGKEVYVPCKNTSENQIDFILDPMDYARASDSGQILAIVHSHCDISSKPSQADLVACEHSGLPWIIVSIPGLTWDTIQPSGYKAPLLGRKFSHGVLDCYSLLRDWYKETWNVDLPDFDREQEWWKKGANLYLENFEKAGFERTEELEYGSVILMQIGSRVVNHAAIYIGNNQIIHHVQNHLSCRDVYGGYWKKNTRMILKYKGEK